MSIIADSPNNTYHQHTMTQHVNTDAKTTRAFHGNQSVKDKYLARVRAHREADNLTQGVGWENGKGCAIGCTLENYSHDAYPMELGLPVWLAHLEDHIFEALPKEEAMLWPEQFLSAIPIGYDAWNAMRDEFQLFWLKHNIESVAGDYAVVAPIKAVITLLQQAVNGNEPESAAWSAAESAAWSAAESAARSAAESAARSESLLKRDWLIARLKGGN